MASNKQLTFCLLSEIIAHCTVALFSLFVLFCKGQKKEKEMLCSFLMCPSKVGETRDASIITVLLLYVHAFVFCSFSFTACSFSFTAYFKAMLCSLALIVLIDTAVFFTK